MGLANYSIDSVYGDSSNYGGGYTEDNRPIGQMPAPKKNRNIKSKLRSAGGALASAGRSMMASAASQAAANSDRQTPLNLPSYRKGGRVKKTGPANLHRGEYVVPKKHARKVERMLKRRTKSRAS